MSLEKGVTTIDILRHGETEGGEIFRGSTDVLLNADGLRQMQEALAGKAGWEYIVTSPLLRCLEFSRQLAVENNIEYGINTDLREISFGEWDGCSFADVRKNDPERFNHFWRDPANNTPPFAEPLEQFCQRVVSGFWHEVEEHNGMHILMVVHGGVVRAILSEILQTPIMSLMRFDVPYACLTRIKIYHDNNRHWPQLVFHNR